MSPVEYKKRSCQPVEFKGQGHYLCPGVMGHCLVMGLPNSLINRCLYALSDWII